MTSLSYYLAAVFLPFLDPPFFVLVDWLIESWPAAPEEVESLAAAFWVMEFLITMSS